MKTAKLSPKEARRRYAFIAPGLEEARSKVIEYGNKALYAEQEEKMWLKRLWRIQLLCPHRNRQDSRAESEARNLPYNKRNWICLDCGFYNPEGRDREFEKSFTQKKREQINSKKSARMNRKPAIITGRSLTFAETVKLFGISKTKAAKIKRAVSKIHAETCISELRYALRKIKIHSFSLKKNGEGRAGLAKKRNEKSRAGTEQGTGKKK